MMNKTHPLNVAFAPPSRFTYPFCYEPHRLCEAAAAEVREYIKAHPLMRRDADRGKMFGVLVVETAIKKASGIPNIAFLAAYSGLLAGRNDSA